MGEKVPRDVEILDVREDPVESRAEALRGTVEAIATVTEAARDVAPLLGASESELWRRLWQQQSVLIHVAQRIGEALGRLDAVPLKTVLISQALQQALTDLHATLGIAPR